MRRVENDIGIEVVPVSKSDRSSRLNNSTEKDVQEHVARFRKRSWTRVRWTGSFARHGSIPLDRAYERGEKLKGNRNGSRAWKRERERESERGGGERRWGEEGLERRGGWSEAFRFRSANSFHLMRGEEALDQSWKEWARQHSSSGMAGVALVEGGSTPGGGDETRE